MSAPSRHTTASTGSALSRSFCRTPVAMAPGRPPARARARASTAAAGQSRAAEYPTPLDEAAPPASEAALGPVANAAALDGAAGLPGVGGLDFPAVLREREDMTSSLYAMALVVFETSDDIAVQKGTMEGATASSVSVSLLFGDSEENLKKWKQRLRRARAAPRPLHPRTAPCPRCANLLPRHVAPALSTASPPSSAAARAPLPNRGRHDVIEVGDGPRSIHQGPLGRRARRSHDDRGLLYGWRGREAARGPRDRRVVEPADSGVQARGQGARGALHRQVPRRLGQRRRQRAHPEAHARHESLELAAHAAHATVRRAGPPRRPPSAAAPAGHAAGPAAGPARRPRALLARRRRRRGGSLELDPRGAQPRGAQPRERARLTVAAHSPHSQPPHPFRHASSRPTNWFSARRSSMRRGGSRMHRRSINISSRRRNSCTRG